MRLKHLVLLVFLNVIWSGSLSMYKALGAYLPTGGIVTLRFGLAALGLLVFWPWLPGSAPRGKDLLTTGLMGFIVFCLGHRLQVFGNQLGSAGNSAVLMGLEPLLTSIAAAVFLREHITARRWAGFSLGMLGVLLLNGVGGMEFRLLKLGASLIFLSSFLCEAAYSIMGKPLLGRVGLLKILALALALGTLANLAIDGTTTLVRARTLPACAWWWLAYLAGLCTLLGFSMWYVVIRETEVNVAALTIFVQPLAGIPLAALWLKEELHWGQLWGSLAIVAGLIVGLARNRPAKRGPEVSRGANVPKGECSL